MTESVTDQVGADHKLKYALSLKYIPVLRLRYVRTSMEVHPELHSKMGTPICYFITPLQLQITYVIG